MAKDSIATPQRDIDDIANDIDCAIAVLRDLLMLSLQERPAEGCKADSAIRAAGRYVDDIAALNQDLFEHWRAAKGGA